MIYTITPDINHQQFLITHIKQPDRLFDRLYTKNIPKTDKIQTLLSNHNIMQPDWLINIQHVHELIENFINGISIQSNIIYNKYFNNINGKHQLILFIQKYVKILDRPDIIQFEDLNIYYDNMDELLINYIKPYHLNESSEITTGYIKKIRGLLTNHEKEYCDIIILLFKELDNMMTGVNLKRLVGLYHIFSSCCKILINKMMPIIDNNNKDYFYIC